MTAIDQRFRTTELVLFSSGRVNVLFSPRTLQMFLLNEQTAGVFRDLLAGMNLQDTAVTRRINITAVTRLMDQVLCQVENAPPLATDTADSISTKPYLPKLVLMVNNYCNLKCTYCYEHETIFQQQANVMSIDIVQTALDKFYDAFSSIGTLMFIGGEPTLNAEVIDFACSYASQLAEGRGKDAPAFCMITNGVKLDAAVLDIIAKYAIQATFSVDGPKPVNDLVRIRQDNSGSYDAVARSVRRYSEAVPDKAGLECTLTSAHHALGMTVSDVLSFAYHELGITKPHIAAAGLTPGHKLDPFKENPERLIAEFSDAAAQSMDVLLSHLLSGAAESLSGGVLDVVASMFDKLVRKRGVITMCPAGTSQLVVDAFGDIYPCWMFAGVKSFFMGNILRDEIFNSTSHNVLNRIEANVKTKNAQCSVCYARYVCSACIGNNHNTTGSMERIDENYCRSVRSILQTVTLKIGELRQDPERWNRLSAVARIDPILRDCKTC